MGGPRLARDTPVRRPAPCRNRWRERNPEAAGFACRDGEMAKVSPSSLGATFAMEC
jgi:hypothetical protein